jgi:uroporphyrin-III C-methyltransferase/precorrin-2 dehydrogenase/sirohydrochlorin ferrochelatase
VTALYPLYHKLENRPVVVIGGGPVALRRLRRLVAAGARVTVISPEIVDGIRELVDTERVEWRQRVYEEGDVEGSALALVASGELDLVRRIRTEADRLGVPLNSAEDEKLCDFHVPGLVEWGGVRLAISSEGASPALVARLREELESWLRDVVPDDGALEGLRAAREARKRTRDALPTSTGRGAPKGGKVYLVGAGPGDPSLLTLRASELLNAADIVYHDRLVSSLILDTIPPRTEKIYVGKDVGCAHRANIVELMIESARARKIVVRLKGGDPVLFGRGGEEMIALSEADVDFEIVPGVSSLCAVPIAANIPVTHRGIASEVVVRSGHKMAPTEDLPATRATPERETTFVYFMAVRRLERVVEDLRAEGLPESTPVAVIENGTLPGQNVVVGTLRDIVSIATDAGVEAPALVVAGEVVKLREKLKAQA